MTTWTESHFALSPTDHPTVCPHDTSVTFSRPGYTADGRGFCLELSRAHIADVQRLLAALAALPPLPSETETDPFV